MPTINQLVRKPRVSKVKYVRSPLLKGSPQCKGVCMFVGTMKPKKPNSAIRKIARILIRGKKSVRVYIPGRGHNLQEHSVVLMRGGKIKDLPGIHYKLIRGKYDFNYKEREGLHRKNRRSKYSIPNLYAKNN